ncbi:hypothetical protein N7540_011552 [Penicillium herquei]|nr:hypothetical protein N7540_011552 [Penicillium herquei]
MDSNGDQVTAGSHDTFRLGQSEVRISSALKSASSGLHLPSPDPSLSENFAREQDQTTPARDFGYQYFGRNTDVQNDAEDVTRQPPILTPSSIPGAFPDSTTPTTSPPRTPSAPADPVVTPDRTIPLEGVDFLRDRPIPRQIDVRVDPVPFLIT